MAEANFTIFFSWQSDLPENAHRRLIREGLRQACSRVEEAHSADGIHIVIDEATNDESGSPSISSTILEKIRKADAFVADLTTINANRPSGSRACPNPNVAIELGYAIGQVGWDRIIIISNSVSGEFPSDLPFDVRDRRILSYSFPAHPNENAKDKTREQAARSAELKKRLFDEICAAIDLIVSKRASKPSNLDEPSPAERKRQRDLDTLVRVFSNIHVPTLDEFVATLPGGFFRRPIFYFWEGFNRYMSSSLFHIYDPRLSLLVRDLHSAWKECLSFWRFFFRDPGRDSYSFEPGKKQTPRSKEALKRIDEAAFRAKHALCELLAYVRESYPEIDLVEMNLEVQRQYEIDMREDNETPQAGIQETNGNASD